jgi:hypothetical protein
MKIVLIEPNKGGAGCVLEEKEVDSACNAWLEANNYIGENECLTTFRGTWEGERVLFLCNDNGMALNLAPNKTATLAYLDQCIPGTMHVILGRAVALIDRELW